MCYSGVEMRLYVRSVPKVRNLALQREASTVLLHLSSLKVGIIDQLITMYYWGCGALVGYISGFQRFLGLA